MKNFFIIFQMVRPVNRDYLVQLVQQHYNDQEENYFLW